MLKQPQEKRQIRFPNALLVERQNERPAFRRQEEIRILDALRDTLERQHAAQLERA